MVFYANVLVFIFRESCDFISKKFSYENDKGANQCYPQRFYRCDHQAILSYLNYQATLSLH